MYIYTMWKSTIQRQKIIADLIDEGKITSQNQLKGILNKKGIPITQATLSRDLSEIGATKRQIKKGEKPRAAFLCKIAFAFIFSIPTFDSVDIL